jgi:predicted ester cyclase
MTNREALNAFYNKALTLNTETTPEKVLTEILADNFVSKGSVENKIKEQLIGQLGFFWKLIPDLKWEPQEILNEGNKYIVRSLASGTPNGDFMGLPTDGTKSFSIMTIDIHTIIDGKVIEVHHLEDWGTAIKQLKS